MVSYKKQWPGYRAGTGTYGWESSRGLDMSEPGTFIRPDIPLGSGPSRNVKTTQWNSTKKPDNTKKIQKLEESKVFKCDPMHMRYSTEPMNCAFPIKCPPKSDESGRKPMRCPETQKEWGTIPAKCPAKPTQWSEPTGNFDNFPIAMAYVPWQHWQQIYPVEMAMSKGTLFAELDKPFMMGGCNK